MVTSTAEMPASRTVDLPMLVEQLVAKRWWIIATVVTWIMLFGLVAFLSTPIYRASVLLIPANIDGGGALGNLSGTLGQLGGLASLAGIDVSGRQSETEEALAVLTSRHFTDSFIRDRNLMPVLYAHMWDDKLGRWKVPENEQPTAGKAYKLFERIRSVKRDDDTHLITLQVEWKDRMAAAVWANDLVERLNAEMRARAIAHADASVGYLERELNGTTLVAAREALNRLIEAQIKQRMLANVTREYSFRVVDRAVAPDRDDPVSPRKLLLLVGGALFGTVLGVLGVSIWVALRQWRGAVPRA